MRSSKHAPQGASIGMALVVLLAMLTALDAMAIDMYLPGMPAIGLEFDISAGEVQQTLAIFLIGLAFGQGLYGPLLDSYGRRVPLLAGVLLFVLGSIVAALAPSIEWLMAARFLQALGAAAGLVAPRAIVADRCNVNESARIFSVLMQVMMLAPILAPVLGGYLLQHGGWRSIFWALAALGMIGVLWGLRSLPETLPAASRAPLRLRAIFSAYGRQLVAPVFMAYVLAGGFVLGALFTYISGAPFVFTQHYGLDPQQFSYLFASNAVCLVLFGAAANAMLKRGASEQRGMYIGLVLHTLAGAGLWLAAGSLALPLWGYAALLTLAIGSLGLVFGNLTALTMAHAGPQAGLASALMGMLQYLLSAVVGYVVSFAGTPLLSLPATVAICGGLAILCCLAAEGMRSRARAAASAGGA